MNTYQRRRPKVRNASGGNAPQIRRKATTNGELATPTTSPLAPAQHTPSANHGMKRLFLSAQALTLTAGSSTSKCEVLSSSPPLDTHASLPTRTNHYLKSGHLDLTKPQLDRNAPKYNTHTHTHTQQPPVVQNKIEVDTDPSSTNNNDSDDDDSCGLPVSPVSILITDHDYTHPNATARTSTLPHPCTAVLTPQSRANLSIPIPDKNPRRRQFVHYLPHGAAGIDEATTSVAVRQGRYVIRLIEDRGCKAKTYSRHIGRKWMRYSPEQLKAEMQEDERLDWEGKDKEKIEMGDADLRSPTCNGGSVRSQRSTVWRGHEEVMPVQRAPANYLRPGTHRDTVSESRLSPISQRRDRLVRSGAACTCTAKALAVRPCIEEEGEAPDEVAVNGAWVDMSPSMKVYRMRNGKEKGKGRERAQLTWSKCITAEKRARALESAGRYNSRVSAKGLAEAAAVKAEIAARTDKLMAERLESVKAREEKVKKATECLIDRENTEVMQSHRDEEYDSESSESVYDDSSDDENPPSIVEDILLAAVERDITLVRQNSDAVRSQKGMVVTTPKPKVKGGWQFWFRWMFCIPSAKIRKPEKLQKKSAKY